jgi:magnesium transporter
VDLCAPDQDHLQALAAELSLDPLAVEDALNKGERPKATRYATHLFLTTSAVTFDTTQCELSTTQVSVFVLPRGIVTVRQNGDFVMDRVVRGWDDNADLIKYGVRALVYVLLDVIVDGYFETVENLDDEIEGIEDHLFDGEPGMESAVQRRVYQLRKTLVQARRYVLPMREVVNTIMHRAEETNAAPELAPYYADLYDHVIRAAEWTESLRDMITSIFETNLSLADARLNTIMKKLTSWAAIIAVPTAITGYFGQNVPYPGFGKHWGFWFSLLLMVAIAGALYGAFKRRDWL